MIDQAGGNASLCNSGLPAATIKRVGDVGCRVGIVDAGQVTGVVVRVSCVDATRPNAVLEPTRRTICVVWSLVVIITLRNQGTPIGMMDD